MKRKLALFGLVLALLVASVAARTATKPEVETANKILLDLAHDPARQRQARETHCPFGLPVSAPGAHGEHALYQPDYVIWHDDDLREPLLVSYRLTTQSLSPGSDVDDNRIEKFRLDPRLTPATGGVPKAYTGSGYDKGHMTPNDDMVANKSRMINSYILSNICPQSPSLNRTPWRVLETDVRTWARRYGAVWVMTGAVFDKDGDGKRDPDEEAERIGETESYGGVAVPTGFYKIVLRKEGDQLVSLAVLLPQTAKAPKGTTQQAFLRSHLISIKAIESVTGLTLLPGLSPTTRQSVEARAAKDLWPLN